METWKEEPHVTSGASHGTKFRETARGHMHVKAAILRSALDYLTLVTRAASAASRTHHGRLHPSYGLQRRHLLRALPMAADQGVPMAVPALGREVLLPRSQQQERAHNAWQGDFSDCMYDERK